MQINIAALTKIGSAYQFTRIITEKDLPNLDHGGQDPSPIGVSCKIIKTESGCLVTGKATMDLTLICSRCLSPFVYHLQADFSEAFTKALGPITSKEDDLDFDGTAPVYTDDILDLTGLITESIMLAIPMKAVCQTDCRGICPDCGQSLNDEVCNCAHKKIDPRLAVLGDLFDSE